MREKPVNLGLPLFAPPVPERLGHAAIYAKDVKSILNEASGFMDGYDYTLNPYSGCAFGCTYCYAAAFARDEDLRERWGEWVEVKQNAVSLLRRFRKPLRGATIYMSSVTDPYQPIENQLGLVRALLEELVNHQPRLVIQTRSPLVVRDLDLLKRFAVTQVNMTVTTDDDDVRRIFEPTCPGNRKRLEAIREVQASGVRACVTMTPLLPVTDANRFADELLATGVRRFVVQPFHAEKGRFVAGTREAALAICRDRGWDLAGYERAASVLRARLPELREGKVGFAPV